MRLTATMRQLADSRAEMVAATRFFRNPKVTAAEIVATAAAQTAVAAAGRHVLLVEDTSEINFEGKAGRKRGLGRVGNGSDVGLFIHPAIAVDATDGTILGLAGATLWRRHKAKAEDYQAQPIETKESHRWIVTARTARAALAETPLATVVADREADIYELFARLPEAGPDGPRTHLLVRCHHDRTLAGPGRNGRACMTPSPPGPRPGGLASTSTPVPAARRVMSPWRSASAPSVCANPPPAPIPKTRATSRSTWSRSARSTRRPGRPRSSGGSTPAMP
jgi:hypothetical protein